MEHGRYCKYCLTSPVNFLGLKDLRVLHMEGCRVSSACMETIAGSSYSHVETLPNRELKDLIFSISYVYFALEFLISYLCFAVEFVDTYACISGFILMTCLNIKSCNIPDSGVEKLKGIHDLPYLENLVDWIYG